MFGLHLGFLTLLLSLTTTGGEGAMGSSGAGAGDGSGDFTFPVESTCSTFISSKSICSSSTVFVISSSLVYGPSILNVPLKISKGCSPNALTYSGELCMSNSNGIVVDVILVFTLPMTILFLSGDYEYNVQHKIKKNKKMETNYDDCLSCVTTCTTANSIGPKY
jgi:hypothetical protein